VRFLIDECLSIDLVSLAARPGTKPSTLPVPARLDGRTGTSRAMPPKGNFVVVTNNASDFRRLYATQPLHAGIVIIIPNVNRVEQPRLFLGALDELARSGEPVNRVLEVDIEGDEVTFKLYDLPADSS